MTRPSATANGPRKPLAREIVDEPREDRARSPLHGIGAPPVAAMRAERIEAEARIVDGVGRDAARRFTSAAKCCGASRVSAADVEVDRDAGIEIDAVEHAFERLARSVEAVAVRVERAREHERQPGRAVLQIVQRLLRSRRPDRDDRRAASPSMAARRARRDRQRVGRRADRAAGSSGRHRCVRRAACRMARP